MKRVRSNGADINFDHIPRPGAPALLMLNSLGADLHMWDEQVEALGSRYEMIRYDARGHGASSVGDIAEPTLEVLARDALAVLDACGVARAHLCGLSLGGMTAMHIAAHWPDRVLKAVLSNTSAHMPPKENWDARIKSAKEQGMAALADTVIERWFTPRFRTDEPDRVERVRQMLLSTQPAGYAACCAAIRDMDLRETIKSITATTLVIGGTQDPATPPEKVQFIADTIPGAQLVLLDAAHLSNIEQAAEFNRAVVEFLAA